MADSTPAARAAQPAARAAQPSARAAQPAARAAQPAAAPPRLWVPRRVLVTRSAADLPHTAEILGRCRAAGVEEIEHLTGDRLASPRGESDREAYARAKSTLAVVVAPPSALRPQPIPPSADWRIDLARGCPAHCQYCYLAGSLAGPPITRVYANLDDVLDRIATQAGTGHITSGTKARGHEGTTFELSCYTDPLGIDAVTGSLSAAVERVGAGRYGDDVSLRFTTKYDGVEPLLGLHHGRRTRARFSVNAAGVARRFEAGTAPLPDRIAALGRMAAAGYRVGLTIAPIMPVPGWRDEYGQLLDDVAATVRGVADLDLTVELITHRFTPGSRDVLERWYPRSTLEMDPGRRSEKRSKFGGVKYVYPKALMGEMRSWFEAELPGSLPGAPILYWT